LRKTQIRVILICVGIVAVVAGILVIQPTSLYGRYFATGGWTGETEASIRSAVQLQVNLGWASIGVGACLVIIGPLKYVIWFFNRLFRSLGALLRRVIRFVADLSRD